MRARASIRSHPIHPILVTFPIGLWWTSLAFDAIGAARGMPELWAAGWYAALAGVCGALLAAIFGAIDLFTVVPPRSSGRAPPRWSAAAPQQTDQWRQILPPAVRRTPRQAPRTTQPPIIPACLALPRSRRTPGWSTTGLWEMSPGWDEWDESECWHELAYDHL